MSSFPPPSSQATRASSCSASSPMCPPTASAWGLAWGQGGRAEGHARLARNLRPRDALCLPQAWSPGLQPPRLAPGPISYLSLPLFPCASLCWPHKGKTSHMHSTSQFTRKLSLISFTLPKTHLGGLTLSFYGSELEMEVGDFIKVLQPVV